MARKVALRVLSLKRKGEPSAQFARRTGLSPQVVSNWENGGEGLSVKSIMSVIESTGVNAHWLLTGDEPMMHTRPTEDSQRVALGRAAMNGDLEAVRKALRAISASPEDDGPASRERALADEGKVPPTSDEDQQTG